MSLFFGRQSRDFVGATAQQLIPDRMGVKSGAVTVTLDSALRSSAVWACLRLRADLISTMPLDVFRRVDGVQVEVPKPPVLVMPGGERVHITEWLYSTQVELDRSGNAVGVITERDGANLPRRIDLVPFSEVTAKGKGSEITKWLIGKREYDPRDIWHEKQWTLPGVALGLSPIAYAAWSVGSYLSAQQFALDWFTNSAGPGGHLKNTARTLNQDEADIAKRRFKTSVQNRDVMVTGSDWEYQPGSADASQAAFLDSMKAGVGDIARFLGVPGDMIDAEGSSSSITYANVTQRNLQLLIMNLGPAIVRREAALSMLLPQPRFVKFNTDAILRMDPAAVTANIAAQKAAGLITTNEGRALLNRPPVDGGDSLASAAPALPAAAPTADQQANARAAAPAEPAKAVVEIRQGETPAPVVNVTVEPTPVTVVNEVAAPVVNVEPTPVTVDVAAPDVRVDVAAPSVTVDAPVVNIEHKSEDKPKVKTTTYDRDGSGLVVKSTTTERPA